MKPGPPWRVFRGIPRAAGGRTLLRFLPPRRPGAQRFRPAGSARVSSIWPGRGARGGRDDPGVYRNLPRTPHQRRPHRLGASPYALVSGGTPGGAVDLTSRTSASPTPWPGSRSPRTCRPSRDRRLHPADLLRPPQPWARRPALVVRLLGRNGTPGPLPRPDPRKTPIHWGAAAPPRHFHAGGGGGGSGCWISGVGGSVPGLQSVRRDRCNRWHGDA